MNPSFRHVETNVPSSCRTVYLFPDVTPLTTGQSQGPDDELLADELLLRDELLPNDELLRLEDELRLDDDWLLALEPHSTHGKSSICPSSSPGGLPYLA